ncbi:phosphotyrosine protein phosphatase [Burkholderia territorii]|uniref:low molecular weight protein tyrosine phosphatase family protein n=1 Tax=Burkholderia territorii TaxID=1503055 RepID=UPI00075E3F16|nr:low molecular weight protein tyrosine phosphatase family protein [Burkholderia territorii]KUY93203.1 phosphotyrosine protein phosphatase [Burkholderia territorii]KUZ09525.1 phosphotyrosine protein phosphatase [Burkholderia territorii]
MTRALFVCSRNRLRSPTAEAVFTACPGVEAGSAGLAPDAQTRLSAEQLEWAEIVFVMERAHKAKLLARFGARLKHKKIVCLDIPDRYAYMQPKLIALLERKAGPWLRA